MSRCSAPRPNSSFSTTYASPPSRINTRLQDRLDRSAQQYRHRIRDGQSRPPSAHQGRLLPGATGRFGAGSAFGDAVGHGATWGSSPRSITTRWAPRSTSSASSSGRWCRWPTDADLQIRHPPGGAGLWQDRLLHAEADLRRQRLGHACPTSRSGRAASRYSPATNMPICRTLPALHRRHPEARQGAQRLHQPDHQFLQASGAGLRGAGAARLFGAQPLGVVPYSVRLGPEGQARRGALPRSRRQSLSRPSPRC